MSWQARLFQDSLYAVRGRHAGLLAWYILRVPPLRQPAFTRALAQPSLELTEYGEILASGYGDIIPPDIAERYGLPEQAE